MHAIILERGEGLGFCFDEMQNGAIWGHFRVSYNIESSTILMTEFLKIVQNLPSKCRCISTNPREDSLTFFMVDLT